MVFKLLYPFIKKIKIKTNIRFLCKNTSAILIKTHTHTHTHTFAVIQKKKKKTDVNPHFSDTTPNFCPTILNFPIFFYILIYMLREFKKLVMISKNVKNNPNLIRLFLFLKNKK